MADYSTMTLVELARMGRSRLFNSQQEVNNLMDAMRERRQWERVEALAHILTLMERERDELADWYIDSDSVQSE